MANLLSRYINDRLVRPAVQKALSDSQPVAYGIGTVSELPLSRAIGQPHDANYSLLYSLYKLNINVSAGVHKWAGGVTGPGWRITTMDPKMEISDEIQADIDRLTLWLKNPNPNKLFETLLYEIVEHFGVSGDQFWYIASDRAGNPIEIWPMHPAITRIVSTKAGEVLGYVMRVPGGEPIVFETDEVLHFRLPNITNDLYGESPTELALEEAGIDLMALRSNKAIFQNGLSPSAVALMREGVPQQIAKDVTEQITQAHTGAANQHKILALVQVADLKPWTITNRDLEYPKLRAISRANVVLAFRLPLVLFGEHNAGDYATTKFLIRDAYRNVYEPIQRQIAEVLTEQLIHRFNPLLRFEFNKPDASDPDDIRKDQMAAFDKGILTADEVRAESWGKEPLEDEQEAESSRATEVDQQPDEDATDTAQDAPATSKSLVTKAVSRDDYPTEQDFLAAVAEERDRQFNQLTADITPAIANYFATNEQLFLDGMEVGIAELGVDGYVDQKADALDTILTAVLVAALLPSLNVGMDAASSSLDIFLPAETRQGILDTYATDILPTRAAGINSTTRTRLKQSLTEGVAAKEDTARLRERAAQIFQDGQTYRAELIADTESAQAFDFANYESARASELTLQEIQEVWLTERDDRVCPVCTAMDYQAVPADQPFLFPDTDLEMVPGKVHVKCRCTRYLRRISA